MQPYGDKRAEKASMGHHLLAWVRDAIRKLKKRARQQGKKDIKEQQ